MQSEPYAREQAGLRGASSLAERSTAPLTRQAYALRPTRQRLRTAVLRPPEDSGYGDSPFAGFVWFVAKKESVVAAGL